MTGLPWWRALDLIACWQWHSVYFLSAKIIFQPFLHVMQALAALEHKPDVESDISCLQREFFLLQHLVLFVALKQNTPQLNFICLTQLPPASSCRDLYQSLCSLTTKFLFNLLYCFYTLFKRSRIWKCWNWMSKKFQGKACQVCKFSNVRWWNILMFTCCTLLVGSAGNAIIDCIQGPLIPREKVFNLAHPFYTYIVTVLQHPRMCTY